MAQLLKQSTAYTFQLGPFVDATDGVTPETSLTIAATDVDLSKNGGAFADKTDATALTSTGDSQGYYDCVLDTTDTGTLGKLDVRCYVSGALPVFKSFMVVPAHAYDGLVAGTDNLQVDTVQVTGTSQTARDLGASVLLSSGTGTGQISLSSGAVLLQATQTGVTIPTVTSLTNAVTLANGAHGGAAASLNLGAGATISSSDGHALTLTGGTNGHGLLASGAGTGSGLVGSGGSGGGHGLYVVGDAAGMGIYAVGGDGSVSAGMALTSNASLSKYGLLVEDGVVFTNDAGVGFTVSSSGTDQHGMVIVGNGTGGDLVADITGSVTSVTNVVSANVTQWLGSAAATPTVAGVPEVDITHVLGSATTATLDSLSSQINGIGSGTGAALNFPIDTDNASSPIKSVTAVGTQTGTYANTLADDGSNHSIASVGNAIDWVYGATVGAARAASKIVLRGNMNALSDIVTVSAYNFGTPGWDVRTTFNGTTETVYDIPLLAAHTGQSGADTGKVYIRFQFSEADAGTLVIDEAYVQAQTSGSLVGYSDGAIWVNTATSNTNTVPYIDGVADNPVSTIAAALTLAAALNLKRLRIANGSSITLGASVESYSLVGKNWSLALGGQSISGSYIEGATITGTATGASPPEFVECHFVGSSAAPTVPPCTLLRCGINTTATYPLTAGSAGQFLIVDSFSEAAGSGTPYFTFAGANGVNIRRWSGGTNITLNNTATTLSIEVVTGGGQTVAVGGADVEIRGICRSVSLTGVTTDSTVQIDAVTGPISITGADGTVNIYGVCGVVTDSRTGTPLGTNSAISRVNINAEVDTAVLDGVNITRVNNLLIDGSGTELDPWGPAPT